MRDKTAAVLLRAIFVLWLVVFMLSIGLAVMAGKSGSGFTRGFNRLEIFFNWQFFAVAVAVASAVTARLSRTKVEKALRGLGYLPMAVHLLVGAALLCIALVAVLLD